MKRPKSNILVDRLNVARQLVDIFKLERFLYAGCQLASFLLLLWCGADLLIQGKTEKVVGMFVASGVMVATTGGFLWMFNSTIKFVGGTDGSRE